MGYNQKKIRLKLAKRGGNKKRISVIIVIGIVIGIAVYTPVNKKYEIFLSTEVQAREKFNSQINSINEYKAILDKTEDIYTTDEEKNKINKLKEEINEELSEGISEKAEKLISELDSIINNVAISNQEELKDVFSENNNVNKDYFSKDEWDKLNTYVNKYNEYYKNKSYKNARETFNELKEYFAEVNKKANIRRLQDIYNKKTNEDPTSREAKYIKGILVVNKEHGLSNSYAPGESSEAKDAFNKMKNDAAKQGISINAFSVYRSYQSQSNLYNNYVSSHGKVSTDTFSARPGFSEHQTGLAFDIGGSNSSLWGEQGFNNTKEAKWLKENCHKYGFILRYPKGKEWKTGYIYESWHFRYLGVDHSKHFDNNDLTLEEYLGL